MNDENDNENWIERKGRDKRIRRIGLKEREGIRGYRELD
jgi:hypothetical protein